MLGNVLFTSKFVLLSGNAKFTIDVQEKYEIL